MSGLVNALLIVAVAGLVIARQCRASRVDIGPRWWVQGWGTVVGVGGVLLAAGLAWVEGAGAAAYGVSGAMVT